MHDSIEVQMSKILDDYSSELDRRTDEAIQRVARQTVNVLKQTSPRKKGGYAKSWTLKRNSQGRAIVYNKKGSLTHLLERGHISKNQYGSYGRVAARPHIKPAESAAKQMLLDELEKL